MFWGSLVRTYTVAVLHVFAPHVWIRSFKNRTLLLIGPSCLKSKLGFVVCSWAAMQACTHLLSHTSHLSSQPVTWESMRLDGAFILCQPLNARKA